MATSAAAEIMNRSIASSLLNLCLHDDSYDNTCFAMGGQIRADLGSGVHTAFCSNRERKRALSEAFRERPLCIPVGNSEICGVSKTGSPS
jgi:hypothetical protein